MLSLNTIKSIAITISLLIFFVARLSVADPVQNPTLFSSSIAWENETKKEVLLADAPQWDAATLQTLFTTYKNPNAHQLSEVEDETFYGIQFINAFWGPLANPFNKYPRPLKAFVFVGKKPQFYVAPLVQNRADGNYYVFDKTAAKPLLLQDWVMNIKQNSPDKELRFNVCHGYGNLPTDVCEDKSFQDEMKAIYKPSAAIAPGFAADTMPSAHRDKHKDFMTYVKKRPTLQAASSNIIFDSSAKWTDKRARKKILKTVTAWPNYKTIEDNFYKLRDLRFFDDEESHHFLRRATWLYPDDGCWTRAAAIINGLFGPYRNHANLFPRPSKIFAFGNLCVNSTNSLEGSVSWWYHTAPIVQDAETKQSYVLDPSVNPYKPLTVENWMAAIADNAKACAATHNKVSTFNICNGFGTTPYDSCNDTNSFTSINEAKTVLLQAKFRVQERRRQYYLERDVDKVLGVSPPWLE